MDAEYMEKRVRIQALRQVCKDIFNNDRLLATDFADAKALSVDHEFVQDTKGVVIEFKISWYALGKLGNEGASEALNELLRSGAVAIEVDYSRIPENRKCQTGLYCGGRGKIQVHIRHNDKLMCYHCASKDTFLSVQEIKNHVNDPLFHIKFCRARTTQHKCPKA